jgi:hypothetical protein
MDKVYELLQEIKKCPGLYLGKSSLECLYAFLSGYKYHAGNNQSDCLDGFQEYVEKAYHLKTGHNWASIIQFYSQTDKEAYYSFYKDFDNFMKNKN